MAKTQDIKRRIRSVRNTMQLTRAMKMVAASKLRRAQERIVRSRPYAQRLHGLLRSVAARVDPQDDVHPLLRVHPIERYDLVVFTADRGLCGAFNSGILRTAEAFTEQYTTREPGVVPVGKKGRDYFTRRRPLVHQWVDVFRNVEFLTAQEIAGYLMRRYIARETDGVHLVFNEFKSVIQARPIVLQLLPIEPAEIAPGQPAEDYIYEPSPREIFDALLPHYVEIQVFQAMLESAAAEQGARMAAMDSATKNAGELIDALTLSMNRMRQASITTEIIEVVSGAEALG
jgi:F-type H+-transporting ATPase subunit gamma